jgi:hypothetical protein
MMKEVLKYFLIFFILIQLIQIDRSNPKVDQAQTLKADEKVLNVIKDACYDCHSYETKYPRYSYIAPLSWLIKRNVNNGRKALNFSTYASMDDLLKQKRLQRSIQQVKSGMMPKSEYAALHEEAKLSKTQKDLYIHWAQKEIETIEQRLKTQSKTKKTKKDGKA